MNETEETLVRSAQRGDRAAFEELVRRTSRLVFARLYLETGNSHRAEDLLQDTLLTAYRSLARFKEPGKIPAGLFRFAQNTAIDAARAEHRQKRLPTARPSSPVPRPEENIEREELRQQVLAVLRSLPDEYRLALTMRYLAGADYETIQAEMGLTNGSLRGLLHRGLKLLRAEMLKTHGEPEA